MIKYTTDKQSPLEIIMRDSNKNIILEFNKLVKMKNKLNIIYSITEYTHKRKFGSPSKRKGEYGRINKDMILECVTIPH